MLSRDIVRLLVRRFPEVANSLLRCSKQYHWWITSDSITMQQLGESYHKKLSQQFQKEVVRFFHLKRDNVTGDVVDVYLSNSLRGRKECVIEFQNHPRLRKSLGDLSIERQSPSSQDALNQIRSVDAKLKILRRSQIIEEEDSFQRIEDVVSGITHTLEEKIKPKWKLATYLNFLCGVLVVLIFTMFCSRPEKLASLPIVYGGAAFLAAVYHFYVMSRVNELFPL